MDSFGSICSENPIELMSKGLPESCRFVITEAEWSCVMNMAAPKTRTLCRKKAWSLGLRLGLRLILMRARARHKNWFSE